MHHLTVSFIPETQTLNEDGTHNFTCQFGDADCSLSRVQLCALYHIDNADREMQFIACQMRNGADPTGEYCANQVGLPFNLITDCYNSYLGENLQLQAEARTNNIQNPLEWVPTTAFNDVFDRELSRRAEQDLSTVICEQINYDAPICGRPPRLSVQVLLGSLCPDSINFIQNQVYPLYNGVRNHVNFQFIPFGKAYSVSL